MTWKLARKVDPNSSIKMGKEGENQPRHMNMCSNAVELPRHAWALIKSMAFGLRNNALTILGKDASISHPDLLRNNVLAAVSCGTPRSHKLH